MNIENGMMQHVWFDAEEICKIFDVPYYIVFGTRPRQWGNPEVKNLSDNTPQTGTRKKPLTMSLGTALNTAKETGMAIWCRPLWRTFGAYHVYPGGRMVFYSPRPEVLVGGSTKRLTAGMQNGQSVNRVPNIQGDSAPEKDNT